MSGAFVVRPGDGDVLDLGTFQAVVLAPEASTAGAYTLIRTQSEPPGFGPPLHVHEDAAEAFFVLEGEYVVHVDGRQEHCPPGTFAYVPRGSPHTFQVVSDVAGTKLNLFTPAAMTGFFEQLAAAEQDGRATPDVLAEIARTHAMTIVGPVPEAYLGT